MRINSFEDIVSWQKGRLLTLAIYRIYSGNKDFGFRDQIQRASVSIMNNIAEGFERQSDKEFRQFLYIAKGSAGEVRSMLSLSLELDHISRNEYDELHNLCTEISRLIAGLIKSI